MLSSGNETKKKSDCIKICWTLNFYLSPWARQAIVPSASVLWDSLELCGSARTALTDATTFLKTLFTVWWVHAVITLGIRSSVYSHVIVPQCEGVYKGMCLQENRNKLTWKTCQKTENLLPTQVQQIMTLWTSQCLDYGCNDKIYLAVCFVRNSVQV